MKQLIHNYSINLANSEIILNDFTQVYLDRLRLITDVTTNTILYNFADSAVASIVSLGTKSFYLNTLPATVATLDALEIDYETLSGDPVYDAGQRTMANSRPVVLPSDQILSANVSLQGTPNVSFAAGATVTANQGTSPWIVQDNFAQTAPSIATWTAATTINTALAVTCTDYSSAIITFVGTGSTFSAGVITFEVYDGANWFGLQAARANQYTVDSTYTLGVTTQAWELDVGGWQQVRVRLSTAITGTGSPTALITMIVQGAAADPSVIVGQAVASQLQTTAALATGSTLTAYQGGAWNANVSMVGPVNISPSAGGGWNSFQVSALASTVSMSAAAGKFGGYMVMNLNAAPAYLQVFDLTSNVTLGLTVPTAVLPLPANATAANGLAANLELTAGMKLANGLKVGATTTATGATPVSTGIIGTFWYV